jgi:hypothetical protein
MAVNLYRVQFGRQYFSYNPPEIGYFDAVTAGRLVAAGIGTALDALPAAVAAPVPGIPLLDFTDDGGLPIPASSADSAALQSEAGMLPGN